MYRVQMKNSTCVGCVHLLNFHLEAPFSRYISFLNICNSRLAYNSVNFLSIFSNNSNQLIHTCFLELSQQKFSPPLWQNLTFIFSHNIQKKTSLLWHYKILIKEALVKICDLQVENEHFFEGGGQAQIGGKEVVNKWGWLSLTAAHSAITGI